VVAVGRSVPLFSASRIHLPILRRHFVFCPLSELSELSKCNRLRRTQTLLQWAPNEVTALISSFGHEFHSGRRADTLVCVHGEKKPSTGPTAWASSWSACHRRSPRMVFIVRLLYLWDTYDHWYISVQHALHGTDCLVLSAQCKTSAS
jgi:hypothetical protein